MALFARQFVVAVTDFHSLCLLMGRLFASESFAFESSLLQTRVRNLLPINDHFLGQTNQLDCNAIGVSHYAKNPANRSGSIRIVRYEYNANCYLF